MSFYDASLQEGLERSWGPRILVEKDVVVDAAGRCSEARVPKEQAECEGNGLMSQIRSGGT